MKITAHMTDRELAAFQAGRAVEAALAWRARKRLLKLSGLPNFGAIEMCFEGARNSLLYARLKLAQMEPQQREDYLDTHTLVRAAE